MLRKSALRACVATARSRTPCCHHTVADAWERLRLDSPYHQAKSFHARLHSYCAHFPPSAQGPHILTHILSSRTTKEYLRAPLRWREGQHQFGRRSGQAELHTNSSSRGCCLSTRESFPAGLQAGVRRLHKSIVSGTASRPGALVSDKGIRPDCTGHWFPLAYVRKTRVLGCHAYGQFCDPNVPKYNAAKATEEPGYSHEAIDVVETAILANGLIFVAKVIAWAHTGSSSMLAEAVHSFADLLNQSLLVVGLSRSARKPDAMFQYGYNRERFVWSLISAVGIFCVGSGVTIVHGIHGLFHPAPVEHLYVGLAILGLSLGLEGWSLHVAYKSISAGARRAGLSISEYAKRGLDPTGIAVLAEDAAAVAGLARLWHCSSSQKCHTLTHLDQLQWAACWAGRQHFSYSRTELLFWVSAEMPGDTHLQ
eukprot:scaffold148_cov371-Prasinococcus_capsulatus_cf.AAC.11